MLNRRQFISLASSSAGILLAGCKNTPIKSSTSTAHVIIIGGGFAGATAAKTIKKLDPNIQVTLIEPQSTYTSCPASNWVITGIKSINSLAFNYHSLSNYYDVNVIHDVVTNILPEQRSITLSNQHKMIYDRLIVAPGIDFRWDKVKGHNQSSSHLIPHAWKAGTQTSILKKQIQSMRNGGTVVICAPPNPFRCPPGPYERASLIAHYLKKHKPKSKIIILDAKSNFSKQQLFMTSWEKNYAFNTDKSLIEWISMPDNPITRIDVKNKKVETYFGDLFKADVLNYIPAQKAGKIAIIAGLTNNSGWCPVNHKTSESTLHTNIHVIGDASIHSPIPKSAFAANSEAKSCAFVVVSLLNETELIEPSWINTCYSLISPDQGISVAMVYKLNKHGKIYKVKGAGGVTPDTHYKTLSLEAKYAYQWFKSITDDSFG